MSPAAYIVEISHDEHGKRHTRRHTLNVSRHIAIGNLDRASNRALSDMLADIRHEKARRAGRLAELGGWSKKPTPRDREGQR